MRARPIAVLLALALGACTAPADPAPTAPSGPTYRDRVEVEAAVEAFLEGFAVGAEDPAELLASVAGDRLRDWARWINRYRPEREAVRAGRVEIESLRVESIRGSVAIAVVDATVHQPARDEEGNRRIVARSFNGPVELRRDASGWRVVDIVRDGAPMSYAIGIFDEPAAGEEAGIRVEVASVYRFRSGTVATIRIENGTGMPIVLDRTHSLIQAAGRWVGATAVAGDLDVPIPPGAAIEGSLAYHAIPIQWLPEKVFVHFLGGPEPIEVHLPRDGFLPI
ncbi:MAG TPA: hypothetical protein VF097_03785 [Actinomycetota bacterium]